MYFDFLATTPLDDRVRAKMDAFWQTQFGNPHSADHSYGFEAAQAVEAAAAQLNALLPLSAQNGQWIFTSGASEANNLALKGIAEDAAMNGGSDRRRILVSAIEHACVIETARYLERRGFAVEFLPVNNDGALDMDEFARRMGGDVLLVSVMWANNETGVIQPVADVARLCAEHGAIFHSDAAQAAGKIPLSAPEGFFPDMISLSAHKMYGPKGVGALYIGKGRKITPQIHGGGQQGGLRSGTVPVPLAAGLGAAALIAMQDMDQDAERLGAMRDRFEARLREAFDDLRINGEASPRLPQASNVQIPGVDMGDLIAALPEIAVSRGSACGSAKDQVSHVLAAMRMEFFAHECLRVSFGRTSDDDAADQIADLIVPVAQALRAAQKKYA
jgi:cysteine desulfurase